MRLKLSITFLTGFLALGQAITGLASDPFISEIVAANDKMLKDNFGETSDGAGGDLSAEREGTKMLDNISSPWGGSPSGT